MAGLGIGGGSLSLNATSGTATGNGELLGGNGTTGGKGPNQAVGPASGLATSSGAPVATSGFAMLGLGKKYALSPEMQRKMSND